MSRFTDLFMETAPVEKNEEKVAEVVVTEKPDSKVKSKKRTK